MDLVFTPADKVAVSVHAESGEERPLTVNDMTLSIDLGVCEKAGSYVIPVEVKLPEGYELAGDVTLTVVSAEQETQTEGEEG